MSRSGLFFFAAVAPAQGSRLSLMLHTAHGTIALCAVVRYALKGIGVGVEIEGAEDEVVRYRAFVDSIAGAHSAWSAIGEFVRPPSECAVAGAGVLEHKELVPIGERCRALAILFTRFPPVALREVFPSSGSALDRVEGVSREPVGLRLHVRDRLRMLHVAQLRDHGGYAAVIPPDGAGEDYHLYSLSGGEELAVSAGGPPIFPYFSEQDLELIRRDVVLELPPSYAVPPPSRVRGTPTDSLPPFPIAAAFKEWTRMSEPALHALELLVQQLDAERRIYQIGSKQHEVRLLRSVPVLLRDDPSAEPRSCALMHDGRKMCALFGLDTGALEIRALAANDELLIQLTACA